MTDRIHSYIKYIVVKMRSILLSVMMFLCVLANMAMAADLTRTEILDLFHQAKDLFRQAEQNSASNPQKAESLYRQAAMRYESIATKGGIQNGKLYYNIGNVYFRIKDIGRAILNYRRAQEFIPDDPNLRQNLSYARNFRKDKIEEKQETKVFKTLFFWHYDLSKNIKINLFSIFFTLIWLFSGTRLFFKHYVLGWGLFSVIVLSTMIGGSLITETVSLHRDVPGVILDSEVVARKGNSDNYAPSFTEPLHAGTEFYLLEKRGNWFYIELPDARACWVPEKSVAMVRD